MLKHISLFLIVIVLFESEVVMAADLKVVVDPSRPAYTIFLALPEKFPEKNLKEIKEKVAATAGAYITTLAELKKNKEKHLATRVVRDFYPDSNTVERLIKTLERHPGAPFGLAFNGGITVTVNDCLHAERIQKIFAADPKAYETMHKANPQKVDPIHPEAHFGPLGIK